MRSNRRFPRRGINAQIGDIKPLHEMHLSSLDKVAFAELFGGTFLGGKSHSQPASLFGPHGFCGEGHETNRIVQAYRGPESHWLSSPRPSELLVV